MDQTVKHCYTSILDSTGGGSDLGGKGRVNSATNISTSQILKLVKLVFFVFKNFLRKKGD